MPGYCVAGTVGHRILHGERRIQMGSRVVDIKMKVEYMSFSAHADAKGIMQLVRMVKPKNLMFVHGEAAKVKIKTTDFGRIIHRNSRFGKAHPPL